jgi:hypothetical protein
VSDLLSRLAARAVGEAPRAQPRIAILDDVGVVAPEAAPEAVADALAARAIPVAPAVRSETPETRVTPPPARQPLPAVPPPAAAERAEDIAEQRTVDAPSSPEPAAERVEPQVAAARVKAAPAPPVVPAAPALSAPVVTRIANTHVERVHTVATMAADEPPVRVHIGRLEVRANLEQTPPQPSPREPDRPEEGPSLADYLRGRQSA